VKELVGDYAAKLGGNAGPATLAEIMRAAESVVIAEGLRAKALRGEPVDMAELNKANGVAARSVKALGIKPGKAAVPSLADHLARRAAERAGERSGGPA
jgi:hypothetical protein